MGTWTVITITEAPRLTEKKLLRAIDRAGLGFSDWYYHPRPESLGWQIEGSSKWEAEGIHTIAEDLSRRHPGSRVEIFEEWDSRDADESGQTVKIYRDGEFLPQCAQENGLVPSDLVTSIAAVRAALAGTGDLPAAALWLVNGLDGRR